MAKQKLELRCSADVVHYLGVERPATSSEHRKLRDVGDHMVVRDHETMSAFFWPLTADVTMVSS